MNNLKVNLNAQLNITGVKAKNLKGGKIDFEINTKPFDAVVKGFKAQIQEAVKLFNKIKAPDLKLRVDKSSLATIRKQIKDALKDLKINVSGAVSKGASGGGSGGDTSNIDRINKQIEKNAFEQKLKGIKAGEAAMVKAAEIERKTARENFQDKLKQLKEIDRVRLQGIKAGEAAVLKAADIERKTAKENFQDKLKQNRLLQDQFQKLVQGGGGGGAKPPSTAGGAGFGGDFSNFVKQLDGVDSAAQRSTNSIRGLRKISEEVARKASAFRAIAIGLNTIVDSSKAAARFIVDFDSQLRDLNKILKTTSTGISDISHQILSLSRSTGISAEDVAKTAVEFARAGLEGRGFGSVIELTDKALLGAQGTTLSLVQSTDILIQTIGQVESGAEGLNKELVTTTRLFDVLGRAEDVTASQASDVQEAFKRSAGTLFQTNASLEEVVALLSVTEERTKRGGDVIGTAFKTIATRITDSASDASKALESIGVAVTDTNGKLRSIFDIVQDTALAFQQLSQEEQANISATVAGTRQVEIFRSVITSSNRSLEVYNDLLTASGDASRKQAEEQKKLSVQIERIKAQLLSIVSSVDTSGIGKIFRGLLQVSETLLGVFIKVDAAFGNALSSAIGFSAVVVIVKTLSSILLGIKDAIKPFLDGLRLGKIEAEKTTASVARIGIAADSVTKPINAMNTGFQKTVGLTDMIAQKLALITQQAKAAQAIVQQGGVLPMSGPTASTGPLSKGQRTALLQDPGIAGQAGAALRPEKEFQAIAAGVNKSISELAARLVITGKATDLASAKLMAINQLYTTQTGILNKMGQQATKLGAGLLNTSASIATSSIGVGILGSVLSSFGAEVKKGGHQLEGAALEVAGLAAQGTSLGLLFGPLGGVIGGVGGAIIGLTNNLSDFNSQIKVVDRQLTLLGKFEPQRIGDTEAFGSVTRGERERRVASASEGLDNLRKLNEAFKTQGIAPTIEFKDKLSQASDGVAEKFRSLAQRADEFDPGTIQRELDKLITGSLSQAVGGGTSAFSLEDLQSSVLDKAGVKFSKDVFENLAKVIVNAAPTEEIKQSLQTVVDRTTKPSIEVIKGLTENLLRQSRGSIAAPDVAGIRQQKRFESIQSGSAGDLAEIFEAAKDFAKVGPAKLASDIKLLATSEQDLAKARLDSLRIENDLAEQSRIFASAQRDFDFADQLKELGDIPAKKISGLVQNINIEFGKLPKAEQSVTNFVDLAKTALAEVSELSQDERKAVKSFFDNFIESQKENIDNIQRSQSTRTAIGAVESSRSQIADKEISQLKDLINIEQQRVEVNNLLSSSLEKIESETRLVFDSNQKLVDSLSAQVEATKKALEEAERNKLGQDAVAKAQDTLSRQQKELAMAQIDVERKLINLREEGSKLRIANAQKENDALLDLVKGRNRLVDLLGVERKGVEQFTVELDRNQEQFKIAMRTFTVETAELVNSGKSAAAVEEGLKDIRMRASKVTLDAAIAEAEILKKRQDAVKELATQILSKESEIQNAQKSVIDATASVAEAFKQYRNAVQEVIASTTQYNIQLGLARITAGEITGAFKGTNDRAKELVSIFTKAEDSVRRLGAGEKIIADIRKQSIEQQISLFRDLLAEQSNLATSYFTSTAEDQQKLIQGIKTAQSVANLLGGSFDNFKKLGEGAINDLGKQLLNLPQEIRQNLLQAVDTLQKLGVSVKGFTADQLKTAIQTTSLGTSAALDVDPLFEVQQKIADLTEEQSKLQLDAIIAANEQVRVAKDQLSQTQAGKALAEIQLERLKQDGMQLRQKIGEMQTGLDATLLTQIDVNRQGFTDVVSSINQLSSSLTNIVNSSIGAGNAPTSIESRSKMIADAREGTGSNMAALAGGFGASTLVNKNISDASATGSRTSNLAQDSPDLSRLMSDLNKKVQSLLDTNTESTVLLSSIEEKTTAPAAAGATLDTGGDQNINVTIDAQNQITVNGLDRATEEIVRRVREETGNFITREQLTSVIDRILSIEVVLRNRNLIVPGANQIFPT